jgi:hypothetical protein
MLSMTRHIWLHAIWGQVFLGSLAQSSAPTLSVVQISCQVFPGNLTELFESCNITPCLEGNWCHYLTVTLILSLIIWIYVPAISMQWWQLYNKRHAWHTPNTPCNQTTCENLVAGMETHGHNASNKRCGRCNTYLTCNTGWELEVGIAGMTIASM